MNNKIFRGLAVVSSFLLASSITASTLMEKYSSQLDQVLGTQSSKTVYEKVGSEGATDPWNFKGTYTTVEEAVAGYKDFAIREAQETFALLKNKNNALPLSSSAKVTLMGLRSYAAIYGNTGGSIADDATVRNGNTIYEAFEAAGFKLNPSMLTAYKNYCSTLTWGTLGFSFGATPPQYAETMVTDSVPELSLAELALANPAYASEYESYHDAAIVVVGRPGGESVSYELGGRTDTTTGNIMGLSDEEKEIIKEAKDHFDKVIVLVNSITTMEIKELRDDPDIDAVMWIGYPGAYGFHALADVLNGKVSPSAYLGDIHVANNGANPAMQSYGNIPWANAADFSADANVNSYLIEAEGIYSGYRYYETRYADIVNGVPGAATAKAGTYTNANGTLATDAGTWQYQNEVVYPFGYGLSYTTFSETLDNVSIAGDKKTATVTVTVKNTGSVAGKKAVQFYAQTPYTDYDKTNKVEKAAVQLVDFEKTRTLKAGESQTLTLNVDLSNIASYDYVGAKTFILDAGNYYFAIGDDSHDALNNILAAQGKSNLIDFEGNAVTGDSRKTHSWSWSDLDTATFRYEENGTEITNKLSEGDYAMDYNAFEPGKVTYLSRSDWNGTFPVSYAGLSVPANMTKLMANDFIPLKSGETSDVVFGDKTSTLSLTDLKGASWDDARYEELAGKVTIEEFLAFAQSAFHNIAEIPSVGFTQRNADDGPGGSDTHYFNEAVYQGEDIADRDTKSLNKAGDPMGTRVAPAPQNLAYSFNKELAYENGEIIIGETSLLLDLPIIIGPGGNLHRHGYNGRGGEYYSEDPILSGFIGSAVVQGAERKGCLVNIKHAAFNDQEINRSGIAVFMNEQKARELELRNLRQMFLGKGIPSSFANDDATKDSYDNPCLGLMTSYNRIGAVAASANKAVQYDILREEWGFHGYNVTDFTGVSLKAAPKESILAGTTAFCGFGVSVDYWSADALKGDAEMCAAIHENIKYILFSLANSNALNGVNSDYVVKKVQLDTWWRGAYKAAIISTAALTGLFVIGTLVFTFIKKKEI